MKKKNQVTAVAAVEVSQEAKDRLVDETAFTTTQETEEPKVTSATNPEAAESSSQETDENNPKRNQDSPGVLTGQNESSNYRNIAWTTEEVAIDQFFHFTLIPDYYLPTEADRPVVAKTPNGYFCIDGWDLIEIARAKGSTAIVADVDNIQEHSDEELCLRKIALRFNTRGSATYAEIIRNSRDIYLMLINTNEDLKVFSHGGRRDRDRLAGNKEEDAVEIISRRIRKDRDTINKQLLHSRYLSDAAIRFFIEKQAPKKFFENIQIKRRILEKNLIGEKRSSTEITEAISSLMITAFEKLLADREAGKSGITPEPAASQISDEIQSSTAEENSTICDSDNENEGPVADENTTESDPESGIEEPVTIETIKTGTMNVSIRLAEFASKDIPLVEIENSLKAELNNIIKLLNMITSLSSGGK